MKKEAPLVLMIFGLIFLSIGIGGDGLFAIGMLLVSMVMFVAAILLNLFGNKKS